VSPEIHQPRAGRDIHEDVATAVVDDGTRGGGDSNHEIGCCRGDHQRDVHKQKHHGNFDRTAANAEKARESTGHQRGAQPERIALRLVRRNHGLAIVVDQRRFLVLYFAATRQDGDRAIQKEAGK